MFGHLNDAECRKDREPQRNTRVSQEEKLDLQKQIAEMYLQGTLKLNNRLTQDIFEHLLGGIPIEILVDVLPREFKKYGYDPSESFYEK